MARERIVVGDFLQSHPDFEFYLDEYAASMAVMADNAERRKRFCAAMRVGAHAAPGWQGLRQTFERVAARVPAYAHVDWARDDYFETLPLIDKNTLRARGADFLSPFDDRRTWWVRETSGTTGPPVPISWAPEFGFDFHLGAEWKIAWLAGALSEESIERDIFSIGIVDKKTVADRVWATPDGHRGLTLRFVFDERDPEAAPRLVERLRAHPAALLVLKPNILASLLPALEARPLESPFSLVVSGGADLDEPLRHRAMAQLRVPVVTAYGMTELGVVASECGAGSELHVYSHDVIVEVLRADGLIADEGRGELVLSSVANTAMPLLRFRTGDLGELVRGRCQCGREGLRIVDLSGRIVRNFRFKDGSELAPTSLNDLFKYFPIREFQVTQSAVDRIELAVEPRTDVAEAAQLLAEMRAYVESETRGQAHIAVTPSVFRPDGKFQRYRSLV